MTPILTTSLPLPLHARGKIRDTYRLAEGELLMVATDRLSAFDVVLPTPIPQKGRVLNQLSRSWFSQTEQIVPNHLTEDQRLPESLQRAVPDLSERSMRVRAAEPILFECVVRGYISGSGWKDYQRTGTIAGEPLPAGLTESDRLPEPIFTPATKALSGHDENISRAELAGRTGSELARTLEELSLALYRFGHQQALQAGIILADTKFEFGLIDGEVILIDEVMTPDSSRFWDLEQFRPGGPQASFDKQYVRDYLEQIGWNKQPPAPALPSEVVAGTTERYLEALQRLTALAVPAGARAES
ncbi:MAG TPA: phosphoribosylaminoimidazolesuccinocarboxamide synthase [Candidatus Dormibacteraeota bacterium]|jgi:phosphoribosylaminoimidazole-succinocarboxamide synthase|nr:phosphoribosylaminoimidazolesuccinocarboxamide synthase [Candidatus Dormibacteraeota bacterium]